MIYDQLVKVGYDVVISIYFFFGIISFIINFESYLLNVINIKVYLFDLLIMVGGEVYMVLLVVKLVIEGYLFE